MPQVILQHTMFITISWFRRCVDQHSWSMLVSSLALLSECDLSHDSITFLTQQLFYLARGEHSFSYQEQQRQDGKEDCHNSPPLLPPPSQISQELWKALHRLPLSEDYRKKVLESVHTHHEFWNTVHVHSSEESESVMVKDIFSLPWRSQESGVGLDSGDICCLNDYVILRCLSEEAYLESVMGLVSDLTCSISVPLLADLLLLLSASACPCVLFYDEACSRSQAILQSLEEDIQRAVKVYKTLCTCSYPITYVETCSYPYHTS